MKKAIASVITACLLLPPVSSVWAQESPAASPSAAAASHPDEIVKMHQQGAAANREYDREVAAARKVFDHKKAEARKKRNAAIEAAQSGVNQQ